MQIMTNRFISIMETIGKDALKGLEEIVHYLVPAARLAEILFPAEAAGIEGVINSIDLIQKAVVTVEQKMAAGGKASGTGIQKAADVLSLVGSAVTQLLTSAQISADPSYLKNLINAVVGVLNVRSTTTSTAPAA